MRLPAGVDARVQLLDLRGSSSSAGGGSCDFELYMYSGESNVYRQWCAGSGPSSLWEHTFYMYSPRTVDIVVDRKLSSATGAIWISYEGEV